MVENMLVERCGCEVLGVQCGWRTCGLNSAGGKVRMLPRMRVLPASARQLGVESINLNMHVYITHIHICIYMYIYV